MLEKFDIVKMKIEGKFLLILIDYLTWILLAEIIANGNSNKS